MTEHEWLACQKPDEILEWIQRWPVVVSDRKLRLFACALVRQAWRLLTDTRSRTAVEVAEQFADGHTSSANLAAARAVARDAAWDAAEAAAEAAAWDAAQAAAQAAARDAARAVARDAAWDAAEAAAEAAAWDAAQAAARAAQANLLRDIVGNPWRPVVLPLCDRCDGDYRMRWIDDPDTGQCPGCIRGKKHLTPTVLTLAQGAYDARSSDGTLDPVRLMILADALEEAGCPAEVENYSHRVGDVVESSDPTNPLCCGSGIYRHAVVTSLDPFALVSEEGDMIWTCTRTPLDVQRAARTNVDTARAMARWDLEKHQYRPNGAWPSHSPHPLLAHLRSPGPHIRGCWAVDCVLGKE